jgi:hypothetical protein
MRISKGKLYGVLTGDIVGFSKLPAGQRSVNRHLQRAGWFAIEEAVAYFEKQLSRAVKI